MTTDASTNWAGKRLGLPESGPGSLAKMPRRIGAIFVDWAAAMLISHAFFKDDSTATLVIFGIMQTLLIFSTGASLGQRILGLRVIRLDRAGRVSLWKALLRSALVCLVIPVAIWNSDNQGMHDKAAGTALVNAR